MLIVSIDYSVTWGQCEISSVFPLKIRAMISFNVCINNLFN